MRPKRSGVGVFAASVCATDARRGTNQTTFACRTDGVKWRAGFAQFDGIAFDFQAVEGQGCDDFDTADI